MDKLTHLGYFAGLLMFIFKKIQQSTSNMRYHEVGGLLVAAVEEKVLPWGAITKAAERAFMYPVQG